MHATIKKSEISLPFFKFFRPLKIQKQRYRVLKITLKEKRPIGRLTYFGLLAI